MHLGYYWPTVEADSLSLARRCQACQLHRNKILALIVELHSLTTPWPFYTWAFDFIRPINPPSRGNIWILATEYYTIIANFIRDNIFCWFGISKHILFDNGTLFINSNVQEFCEEYRVDHVKSSPYYSQRNGQAEARNKTLLRILSRMI